MTERRKEHGFATLHVGRVHGASAVLTSRSRTPVSLLTPRPRGESVWAYTSSFGGGMVAGDCVELEIKVDPGAVCFLGSQASNKVYRNPRKLPCSHRLRAAIGEDALLVLAPDAVQCFAEAIYDQHQDFDLAAGANLVMVDWISAGRLSRGERWSFQRYCSRNEIKYDNRPVVIDAINLDSNTAPLTGAFSGGRFNCMATVVVLGPAVARFAQDILAEISKLPVATGAPMVFSASPICSASGMLLRIAGDSIEQVGRELSMRLGFLRVLLHDDPWVRKW